MAGNSGNDDITENDVILSAKCHCSVRTRPRTSYICGVTGKSTICNNWSVYTCTSKHNPHHPHHPRPVGCKYGQTESEFKNTLKAATTVTGRVTYTSRYHPHHPRPVTYTSSNHPHHPSYDSHRTSNLHPEPPSPPSQLRQ
jgi:hypothetical protein